MSEANEFVSLLQSVQEYISKNYAAALTETAKYRRGRLHFTGIG